VLDLCPHGDTLSMPLPVIQGDLLPGRTRFGFASGPRRGPTAACGQDEFP
jgi:hypothetical protein